MTTGEYIYLARWLEYKDPSSSAEVLKSKIKDQRLKANNEELESLKEN